MLQILAVWSAEHVAKCLVSWHPDDPPALRATQIERMLELQCASVETAHEFLLEVIPPREMPSDDSTVARALTQLYQAGIRPDWWKLSPLGSARAWQKVTEVVAAHDPNCRGVLLMGLEASEADLRAGFDASALHPICRGFAIGRTIFADAAGGWFAGRLSDAQVIEQVADRYARLLQYWRDARASVPSSLAA